MTLQESMDKLIQARKLPTAREMWATGIADGLEPDDDQQLDHQRYASDPVGFCKDVLGLYLTPDQEEFMRAVADPRYEIVQVQSATGVGKTFALGALAVWAYKSMSGCKVYTASAPPEKNLKELLWGEIYNLTEKFPSLFLKDDVKASMHISRSTKEFITGVTIPSSKSHEQMVTIFSGKHAPVLLFIFDEGDGIPDAVFEGADGCMSGGIFIKQIVCFNPKRKEGEAYRRKIDGEAYVLSMSAFSHPNVIYGDDHIVPGAVTKEKTARRINDWTEPLPEEDEPDSTCFEVPDFMVGYKAHTSAGKPYPPIEAGWRRIVDGQFSYKVLGLYPAAGLDQLIRDDWIKNAVTRWEAMRAMTGGIPEPPGGIDPLMGLDVAGGGPDSHIATFRYGGWVEPPIGWKNMDPDRGAEKATRLYNEHGAERCYVDSTGVGAAAPHRMYRYGRDQGWDVSAVMVMVNERSTGWNEDGDFYSVRDEAYWALREAFRTGNIMIPPSSYSFECKRLHQALVALTYDFQGSTIKVVQKKILKKKLGFSPDEVDSLMLTYCPENTWMGSI
jgi:hypothetical protein